MKIGVLAAQGAFAEHISIFHRAGAQAVPVRLPRDLEGLDGLVIPGGESTSIARLMHDYELAEQIKGLGREGLPVMGTCAGMVLLARKVSNLFCEPLGLLDISVVRNAFGRQKESFETGLDIPVLGDGPFPSVFIRAPLVENVNNGVQVLSRLPDGAVVAVRQGRVIAAAFHPELTDDTRFHSYFMGVVSGEQ
jgi:5'-phosphate synthase pdxT subunit